MMCSVESLLPFTLLFHDDCSLAKIFNFQHLSITVNQNPCGTNNPVNCTTPQFPEAHNIIKLMKGIFMYFNCHNQHYFLFSNNTMGKPELKHTFFSRTVSLSFLVTENKLCCYSRFYFHWKIVYGCSIVESALFQMLSLL